MMDQAITRAAGATQIASPLPAATARRQWSLLLTSANHGVVGPLGSTFTHAGERFERVHVVEVPAAAGAPVDQVNLQVVRTSVPVLPVGEFQGYVDGQPSVQWLDRTRMPSVGEKLYAGAAPAAGGGHALTEKQIDGAWDQLPSTFTRGQGEKEWNRENRHAFARAIEREVAAQAGQVAVPEGWKLVPVQMPDAMRDAGNEIILDRSKLARAYAAMLAAAPSAPVVEQQAPAADALDAARYRWLCQHGHERMPEAVLEAMDAAHYEGEPMPKDLIDQVIDKERAAQASTAGERQ